MFQQPEKSLSVCVTLCGINSSKFNKNPMIIQASHMSLRNIFSIGLSASHMSLRVVL